jgi:putative multiple sugar transport system permease protein
MTSETGIQQNTTENTPLPADNKEPSPGGAMSIVRYLTGQLSQIGLFLALIIIVGFFQITTHGITLAPINVSNIIIQNSYILILAVGMVMIIIAGHIDLSVGSVVAFIGALSGVMITKWHVPWPMAVVLCLIAGALVGAAQGYWVAYFGIPAFIVTLAGMLAFRGAAQIVLGNQQISPFPNRFRDIGSGFLPSIGSSGYEPVTMILGTVSVIALVATALRQRRIRHKYKLEDEPIWWFALKLLFTAGLILFVTILLASYDGTPVVLVILALLVIGYTMVMSKTVFGRHIYAIGGNLSSAQLSGVKTQRVTFLLFVNMGVIAALAGLVFTGGLNLASPSAGTGFELDAISAVFIGGAAVTGGIGTVPGAIVGGLIIGVLNNGMSIRGVGTEWQQLIKGLVLLAAVAFDFYNKRRSGGR